MKTFLLLAISTFISLTSYSQIEVFSEQIPMDSILNSAYDEASVVLSPDESQLYFTRKNHPDNLGGVNDPGDIWVSEHQIDGSWSKPVNLKEVNTKGEDQLIGFLDIERRILVYSDKEFISYYRVSGRWFKSKNITVAYFKNQADHLSASLSDDGKIMLLAMESFGTYGVEDLYVSHLQKDSVWSSPKNIGSRINTANQEITPFLASDNKTLFFSSNGHGGEGSFDVFMSRRLDDTWGNWSEPVNLGPKVNTVGWESSFVLPTEKEFAFLISTQNSEGYGDIKRVRVAQEIERAPIVEEEVVEKIVVDETKLVPLRGEVRNVVTNRVIVGAQVEVKVLPSGEIKKGRTNRMGQFTLHAPEGDMFEIKVRAYQYMTGELDLSKKQAVVDQLHPFLLNPIIEGNTIALDHVLFKQGLSELVPGSEKELELVVEMMKYNPDITIFLSGHTDNQGNSSLNLKLSEDRVKAVEKYLVAHGVDADRISGQGFGGTQPRASNANAETRKLNRRVEFTIHKK
ncbi:hypothetical protein BFP72_00045 [Reichenbachiella sp. 5M10]|uniref:OmpA family protein n=1 Tax=Reichenbachiella sp. 5M10 TaxID=1889772 RepID=UPI000C626EE7|nr:OmpA family protein [Reichenbachiella sp. 5M10]PIB33934.1 hypothetical protein BFP72_00045 [Reichenbachiella sp. 5M10]